jgi:hypothetical protein
MITANECQLDFTKTGVEREHPVTQFGNNAEFLAAEDASDCGG